MDHLRHLKSQAAKQNEQWPQYAGHFDSYILVTVTKRIKTKLGIAFEKGDMAIAAPKPGPTFDASFRRFRTVYSLRNQIDTSVLETDIQVLGSAQMTLAQASEAFDLAATKRDRLQRSVMSSRTREENDKRLAAYLDADKEADRLYDLWRSLGGKVAGE